MPHSAPQKSGVSAVESPSPNPLTIEKKKAHRTYPDRCRHVGSSSAVSRPGRQGSQVASCYHCPPANSAGVSILLPSKMLPCTSITSSEISTEYLRRHLEAREATVQGGTLGELDVQMGCRFMDRVKRQTLLSSEWWTWDRLYIHGLELHVYIQFAHVTISWNH